LAVFVPVMSFCCGEVATEAVEELLQGGDLMPARALLPFRSPLRKLAVFFQRSRDKWKEKCKALRRQNKSLKICLAKMKESRDRWKARAMALEAQTEGQQGPHERVKMQPPPRPARMVRGSCPR
jgi:hypothetical protein